MAHLVQREDTITSEDHGYAISSACFYHLPCLNMGTICSLTDVLTIVNCHVFSNIGIVITVVTCMETVVITVVTCMETCYYSRHVHGDCCYYSRHVHGDCYYSRHVHGDCCYYSRLVHGDLLLVVTCMETVITVVTCMGTCY